IDVDSGQIGMNYPVEIGIVGDARTVLEAILSNLGTPEQEGAWKETWQRLRGAEQLKPEWLVDTVRREIPEAAVVFADGSEMGLRMQTDFPAFASRTFFYPSNFATLGWGFSAAVGAASAHSDRWTICVAGDGGFLMTAQELATAVRYKLRLITIIHNDSTY